MEKNLVMASDVITTYINKELEKANKAMNNEKLAPDSKRKAKNNCYNIVQVLEALKVASEIEEAYININLSSNIGVLIEVVVKALLNRGSRKANANEYDLVLANGKRYEIKSLIVGSSRKPSAINYKALEDVLIVSNKGAFIVRRKHVKLAKELGYINGEDRLSPRILEWEHCISTDFTKRITEEWGIDVYEKRN